MNEDLLPRALQNTVKYANHRVECDHGRLIASLRPMRGLKTDLTPSVFIEGHAFIQTCATATTNSASTHDKIVFAVPLRSTNSSR